MRWYKKEGVVQSLNVQAANPIQAKKRSSFEILLRHLLWRFAANDSSEGDFRSINFLYLCSALALPGFFLAIILYPAYHPVSLRPNPRPYFSQVGDHYVYVIYSITILGLAAVMLWESILPDKLDVFVLSILPLTSSKRTAARVCAIALIFGVILGGSDGTGLIALPLVAHLPSPMAHFLAHGLAVLMGGIFIASTVIGIQATAMLIVGSKLSQRVNSLIQVIIIVLLLMTAAATVNILRNVTSLFNPPVYVLEFFPPAWFLGLYEYILATGPPAIHFRHLAWIAVIATGVSLLWGSIAYVWVYKQQERALIESSNLSVASHPMLKRLLALLHPNVLRHAKERSAFYFCMETVFRSSRHRLKFASMCGLGVALAIVTGLHFAARSDRIITTTTAGALAIAVEISVVCAVLACSIVVRTPLALDSAWLFRGVGTEGLPQITRGVVTFSILVGLLQSATTLSFIAVFTHLQIEWTVWITELFAAIILPILASELVFARYASIPFVFVIGNSPERFTRNFVVATFLLPSLSILYKWVFEACDGNLWLCLLFVGALVAMAIGAHTLRSRFLLQENPAVVESDEDGSPQLLGLSHGL